MRRVAPTLLNKVVVSLRPFKGGATMPRASKSDSLKTIAAERADDYMWGIPESPEFSAVQRLMHEFQTMKATKHLEA
jgi:hypothetical protein